MIESIFHEKKAAEIPAAQMLSPKTAERCMGSMENTDGRRPPSIDSTDSAVTVILREPLEKSEHSNEDHQQYDIDADLDLITDHQHKLLERISGTLERSVSQNSADQKSPVSANDLKSTASAESHKKDRDKKESVGITQSECDRKEQKSVDHPIQRTSNAEAAHGKDQGKDNVGQMVSNLVLQDRDVMYAKDEPSAAVLHQSAPLEMKEVIETRSKQEAAKESIKNDDETKRLSNEGDRMLETKTTDTILNLKSDFSGQQSDKHKDLQHHNTSEDKQSKIEDKGKET